MHTSGLAAVDAQLAACERAVCGGGWLGSETGEFSKEALIVMMVKVFNAFKAWQDQKGFSTTVIAKYKALYSKQVQEVEAFIKRGGTAYEGVVGECQAEAKKRFDAASSR